MALRDILVTFQFLALVASAESINGNESSISDVDLGALLDAFSVPFCYKRCMGGFEENIEALFLLTNTMDKFEELCEDYTNATACVKRSRCPLLPVYNVLTSGAEDLCVNKKQFFKENRACLRQNVDQVSQACDNQCQLRQAVADLSHDELVKESTGNQLALLGQFGGVCKATECYAPCYRDRMNAACPGSGTVIVGSLLHPFYQLTTVIEANWAVANFVDKNVPESCLYLTSNDALNKITRV